MQFIRINTSNTNLLQQFVNGAGDSLKTFRYFDKRPFSVVQHHVCTWVMEESGKIEAYGHLDKEADTIWLGIAVAEHARGKGLGKKMMQRLMESAEACGVQKVKLSVDHINETAIHLYANFGFKLVEKRETFGFYEWHATPLNKAVMSTLAFMGQSAENVINIAKENDFVLEFSSGMSYRPDMENIFLKAPVKRFAHNYFPAPEIPFVLNLGSGDEEIRRKSISHCVQGIILSYAVGAPFFSAHAGFCVDPKPTELGQQLSRVKSFDRDKHWNYFIQSIKEVLDATSDLPTGFLLENNVLAAMNVYEDGSNPLLNVEAGEMLRMISEVGQARCGILLDTAHLKVSANTLNFDAALATKKILPHVRCIHHSDNDGMYDNNQPFDLNYWFLPFMREVRNIVNVLEVRKQSAEELKLMEEILF